jgi:penicillin-binding protein 1A
LALGWGESGAATALPAFMDFVKATQDKRPRTQFAKPAGLVSVAIDPGTGLLPYPGQTDSVQELFLAGTLPSDGAEQPSDAGVPGEGGSHF